MLLYIERHYFESYDLWLREITTFIFYTGRFSNDDQKDYFYYFLIDGHFLPTCNVYRHVSTYFYICPTCFDFSEGNSVIGGKKGKKRKNTKEDGGGLIEDKKAIAIFVVR